MTYCWIVLVEHIISYCFQYFRNWEISKKGEIDHFGIKRAKYESLLKPFQIFVSCLFFGLVLSKIITDSSKLHELGFLKYWLLIDVLIMLFLQAFTYSELVIMTDEEILQNISTLSMF